MTDSTDTGDATASSVTTTKTIKTEVVIEPPKQISVLLATMGAFWDWFDKRDVDKHAVAFMTLLMTMGVVHWSMHYAEAQSATAGADIALVLAAINVPLAAFQTAVIKWYFESRTSG